MCYYQYQSVIRDLTMNIKIIILNLYGKYIHKYMNRYSIKWPWKCKKKKLLNTHEKDRL